MSITQVPTGPCRRRTSRIPALDDVWVYWESFPYCDISRIANLSPSGLFLETRARRCEGDVVRLHFLVQEGHIRAEAIVRYVLDGRGLGMKIQSLTSQDAPQLSRLLARLGEHPSAPRPRLWTPPARADQ